MPKPQQQPKTILQPSSMVLLAAQGFALSKHQANDSDTPTVRTFSGIANSGKPFYRWGEASIVDLSDITFKDKIPALDGHDRDKRCGVATLSVENHQLMVSGHLLGNDYGQAVANDADGGFPWQLSVHVQSDAVTELSAGQSETVNGQTVTGPIAILGKNKIREVSFTPTGVDDGTSATVLSDDSKSAESPPAGSVGCAHETSRPTQLSNEKEQTTMTLEQALAKIDTLQETIKTLKAELAEAKKAAKQSEKKSDVNSKLSAAGFKPTGDGDGFVALSGAMYQALLSADSDAADAMIADLVGTGRDLSLPQKPPIPEALLSETTVPDSDNQAGGDALDKILTDKGVYSCRKI